MAFPAKGSEARYLPTREEIERASEHSKKVFIAGPTVSGNVPENWLHAAEVGIDAIWTDYPLELRTTLREDVPKK